MEKEYLNDYIDHLIDVMDSIELNKITILTGKNGGGKSFVRKYLSQFISKRAGVERAKAVVETSMERRIGMNESFGRAFVCDCEWNPTSLETFHNVEQILKTENRFIVIDEIELGVGEELQLGMCLKINEIIDDALSKNLGILVITHSKTIVENLKHDCFINLEGMTEDEWLHRKIVPYFPEDLNKNSLALHHAIEDRLKPR